MKKNVWDLTADDVVLLDGEEYKFHRDFRKRVNKLFGVVTVRELMRIQKPKKVSHWIRGGMVEVLEK